MIFETLIDWALGPLGGIVGAVLAALVSFFLGSRRGQKAEETRRRNESLKNMEKGRNALRNSDDDGSTNDERVHRDFDRW